MTKCNRQCEVFSRVTGYMRPVGQWNKGKKEEFKERQEYCEVKSSNSGFAMKGVPTSEIERATM